ncbi:glycosyltransferase family 2 protein [Porifericola rhodea]|uniref:glycosyltransferase family 2 protein n=1 Tax=Porifericola rhodea TaxID=930972 RepID=UPI00266612F8|nr:glycosyltransferase family 2 protein [Porifericola rhodea]WKN33490.1 glycosyltransferase family 2 protein [Porifericola rhodea]
MSQPKVSIITPTYNSADTIIACLESVISQSYTNIEHLIIDGLSTDHTLRIIKQYKLKYPHIKYLCEKDKGVYDAMNKGISIAAGEWVFFLGSDDSLYSHDILEKIFSNPNNLTLDVIYGNVLSSRFNGPYAGEYDALKLIDQNICHQAIFFKKSLFINTGVFNQAYIAHADWAHNLKWFLNKKYKKKYVPHIISNYSDGGLSSSVKDEKFQEIKPLLILRYEHEQLSSQWKAHWAKHFARESLKHKKLIFFIEYVYFYLKNKCQILLNK